jgi:hypothetical protein
MVLEKQAESVEAKLNLISSLLLDIREALTEKSTLKGKIAYLIEKGVDSDEDISKILGISKSHASKEKAIIRKNE